jgi:hypothetical protein
MRRTGFIHSLIGFSKGVLDFLGGLLEVRFLTFGFGFVFVFGFVFGFGFFICVLVGLGFLSWMCLMSCSNNVVIVVN